MKQIRAWSNFNLATRLNFQQYYIKHESKAQNSGKDKGGLQNQNIEGDAILPEGAGIRAGIDCGTFLTGVESSRGTGDTFNFPGALLSFARIAYRLFWNQFQT